MLSSADFCLTSQSHNISSQLSPTQFRLNSPQRSYCGREASALKGTAALRARDVDEEQREHTWSLKGWPGLRCRETGGPGLSLTGCGTGAKPGSSMHRFTIAAKVAGSADCCCPCKQFCSSLMLGHQPRSQESLSVHTPVMCASSAMPISRDCWYSAQQKAECLCSQVECFSVLYVVNCEDA